MEIPDIGRSFQNRFAIELKQEPENSVGRRVLRAHVEDHAAHAGTIVLVLFPILYDFLVTRDSAIGQNAESCASAISSETPQYRVPVTGASLRSG